MTQGNCRVLSWRGVRGVAAGAVLALTLGLPGAGAAADEPPAPAPWGFNGTFGTGGAGGDFGSLLQNPITWELNFFRQKGPWRAGVGITFASFKMKDPYQDELEWGFQQIYLSGTRVFNMKGSVRPFIQVRGGIARLRPRSELFKMDPLPPDWESGQATQKPTDGFAVSVVPGLELKLSRAAFLETAFSYTYFKVGEYDLSPVGMPPQSAGNAWEARLGITWFPNGEQPGQGSEAGPRDAWHVKRSYGWAAGEVLAINNLGGVAAQWVRNVDWSETSPRSWWQNIQDGLTYDPDTFKTNQWTHPFNGAAYYNGSRANGLGFWSSSAFAFGGAFEWEMAGETQSMSFNDLVSTPIGGITLGESQYRLSSEILDNQASGMGRFWREFGAFFVDPVREFNRLIRGEATRHASNPEDPMDWRPLGGKTFFAAGVRSIGTGSSITNDTKSYATLLLNHTYGDIFENTRRKPFDYLDVVAEINFGEKVGLGNVQLRGDLASWPLGGASSNHVLSIVQHFDYMNNTAYEFGGQSFGGALNSRFRLSDKLGLTTRLDANGYILAGINSEYAHLADVANPERLREYDYGPGVGAAAQATLTLSGRPLLSALYRFAWITVTNGSVYNKNGFGSDADHYIQGGGLRLVIPIKGGFGIGADGYVFMRDSYFTLVRLNSGLQADQHIRQRNPQVRVYLAMNSVR
jgi:uncharacterized protein DUF3943